MRLALDLDVVGGAAFALLVEHGQALGQVAGEAFVLADRADDGIDAGLDLPNALLAAEVVGLEAFRLAPGGGRLLLESRQANTDPGQIILDAGDLLVDPGAGFDHVRVATVEGGEPLDDEVVLVAGFANLLAHNIEPGVVLGKRFGRETRSLLGGRARRRWRHPGIREGWR